MENTEKAILNEEETEAVSGGGVVVRTTSPVNELVVNSNMAVPLEFEDRPFVNFNEAECVISPAPNEKKGFFGWLKNLFNNF